MKNLKLRSQALVLTGLMLACGLKAAAQSPVASLANEFTVSGLRVILKRVPNKVVSAKLIYLGGTRNYSIDKEGIENAALAATAECGTETLSRNVFMDKLESLGSSISGSSGLDNGTLELRCIKPNWDASWALFVDAALHPSFEPKEFELLKQKLMAGVRQREADPDGSLDEMRFKVLYKGTPYEKLPGGSLKSLEGISAAEAKAYYKDLLSSSRVFLVVVGDIQKQDLESKVKQAFSKLAAGSYKAATAGTLPIGGSDIKIEPRSIATNYMQGVMAAPAATAADYRAFQLGMRVMYERMFREVRTKRNLSYAPAAVLRPSLINSSYLYVTTTKPNEAGKVMLDELKKIRREGFSSKEIAETKSEYLTGYLMQQESNSAQASSIGTAQVLFGDWKRSQTVTSEFNAVKPADINQAMKTHLQSVKWIYLGKPEQVDSSVFKQPMTL